MRRLGVSPKLGDFERKASSINDWLNTVGSRLNVYSGANDPVASEVPESQWIVYHNTTLNEVRVWTNIAGVMLKSAAFV